MDAGAARFACRANRFSVWPPTYAERAFFTVEHSAMDCSGAMTAGVNWKAASDGGFPNANVTALAIADSGAVYAGTEPSRMFRSDGEGWQELSTLSILPSAKEWSFPPRPETHHVQSILVDLAKPGRLHVAIEAGALLRSDDAGATWRDRVPGGPRDTHSLAVHPEEPARLHSAAGDGYFESVDGGDRWRRVVDGLQHQYCWSVAVSLADPSTLLLSASQSAYGAHYKEAACSFVYRRTGNGALGRKSAMACHSRKE